ncbi:uncharacterized protein LOC108112466 [Drosophila eugracilis]|uniref:uncharacterized protein LOC108112466 n=1 Tax=Drosophila eugracilis TaxID=29029 RepID=UPI0007E879E1|nr:uncharacterized protein LOC108112466 [Drosophila eugracilis]
MSDKIVCSFLLILFLNFVISVPTTSDTSSYNRELQVPSAKKYYLKIITDGATREETVEELFPGQLQVKGTFQQYFPGSKYLVVIYEAGTRGYVAKFDFIVGQPPIQRLSPNALKTASG